MWKCTRSPTYVQFCLLGWFSSSKLLMWTQQIKLFCFIVSKHLWIQFKINWGSTWLLNTEKINLKDSGKGKCSGTAAISNSNEELKDECWQMMNELLRLLCISIRDRQLSQNNSSTVVGTVIQMWSSEWVEASDSFRYHETFHECRGAAHHEESFFSTEEDNSAHPWNLSKQFSFIPVSFCICIFFMPWPR